MTRKAFNLSVFAFRHNTNHVTKWHNFTKSCYQLAIVQSQQDEDVNPDQIRYIESFTSGYMSDRMHAYCLVMHISNFEEISHHIRSILIRNQRLDNREVWTNNLDRFKDAWKEALPCDLGSIPEWATLSTAWKLRNCLLHANGRFDLVTDAKTKGALRKLESNGMITMINRRIGDGEPFGYIYVNVEYLNTVSKAIHKMLDLLPDDLDEPIEAHL